MELEREGGDPGEDTPNAAGIQIGQVGDKFQIKNTKLLEQQMGSISWPLQ